MRGARVRMRGRGPAWTVAGGLLWTCHRSRDDRSGLSAVTWRGAAKLVRPLEVKRWPWSRSSKLRGSPIATKQSAGAPALARTGTFTTNRADRRAIGRIVEPGLTSRSIDPWRARPSRRPRCATTSAAGPPGTGTRRFPRQRMRSGPVPGEPAARTRAYRPVERTRFTGPSEPLDRERGASRPLRPDLGWA